MTEFTELKKLIKREESLHNKKMKPLYDKRSKLDDIETKKRNSKLLGKCYKYRNACGDDKWWLYYKVIGLAEYGDIKVLAVEETTGRHIIEIRIEETHRAMLTDHSTEITEKQFNTVYEKIMLKIAKS